nr:hypothetical protein [Tanacetum cinerariifolium]
NKLGDLSTHTTKYTSLALTQKVFANMRRVGKGFSRVKTPLFEGMLVAGEPEEQGDAEEQEDKPEVQEVVEVVTTAKLITEVIAAISGSVTAACAITATVPAATITTAPVRVAVASTRRRKGVVIRDPEEESTAIIPAETMSKDKGKEIMNVAGFRLDYFKGMSCDDIRLIFEAKFNSNIEFLLKSKEQIEEEENRAIESINETPAQKAAKRRKLNEEVKDLK